ncbi:MAG: C13 family peptidase [Candidatus Zixiibacteriota bacterium]|jgi:hypothetical protein
MSLRSTLIVVWATLALSAGALAQGDAAPEEMFLDAGVFKVADDAAYNMVVSELLQGDVGKREIYSSPAPLKAGTPMMDITGRELEPPPVDSWVYFVDEMPAANWGHPARLVYVDARRGETASIDCNFPPKMLPAFKGKTEGATREIARIGKYDWRIKPDVKLFDKYPFDGPSENNKYHVLISGGINEWSNNGRYLNDLKFIYYTLQKKYQDNTDDNVYVIYADGASQDLDGDGDNDVDYPASKANVVGVLTTLSNNLTADDELFVYATNHGDTEGGKDCVLCLYYEEEIKDDEFAALINKIQAGKMKFVFEQCFSGGMVDDLAGLSGKNLSVATACDYDEVSYGAEVPPGWGSDGYDEFVYWWTAAMYGAYPPASLPGTHPAAPDPATADADSDGKVTLKEAFDFAKANDRWAAEHPQYHSSPAGADSWTLCTRVSDKDCCGATSKAEAATFSMVFALCYGAIFIRRKYKKRRRR